MARILDWLTNCQPLLSALSPSAPPPDTDALLRDFNARLDKLEVEKRKLTSELLVMRKKCAALEQQGRMAEVNVTKRQMMQHIARCKEIDKDNDVIVGQYNQLAGVRDTAQMLKSSAQVANAMKTLAHEMRAETKKVGGTEGVQSALHEAASTMKDAEAVIGFATRPLIPEGERQLDALGVTLREPTVDEVLDEYLGALEGERSVAASSVREPPAQSADPYSVPVAIGT